MRVHTDDAAAEQADAHNARAFAVGDDIAFAKGQYKPGTPEGDHLLAHEVAHTVQQSGSEPGGELKTTTPGDGAEKNADAAAGAMLEGRAAEVSSEPVAIARRANNEEAAPADAASDGPAGEAPTVEPKGDGEGGEGEGAKVEGDEEGGELSVERVGQEADEDGEEQVGPPQNLEATKQDLAAKSKEVEAFSTATLGDGKGADGGGAPDAGGGDVDPAVAESIHAEVQATTDEAKAEADAFKAEMRAQQDRHDAEQNALTLETLKTMPPAEKRSTLIEMGMDAKSVKKLKDHELDGLISGRLETEQRKTKILGMDADELAKLSPQQKAQFLVDQGVDKKDLDKIGPQKAAKAFDDVMRVAHTPGKHKVKIKIKGGLLAKSWEITVKVDAQGNPEFEAKKKGGFLSKLWGWVKMALPIIAMVLAPVTMGLSLVALSVYQTVTAIASGDWLGAILGAASIIPGIGAFKVAQGTAQGVASGLSATQAAANSAAKFAASGLGKAANVAKNVAKVAGAAKASITAAKAKSPGALMSALSQGAAAFAGFAEAKAGAFATRMQSWADKLDRLSKISTGGEAVVAGIKGKDPAAAVAGAFDAVAAVVSKPERTRDKDGNVIKVEETSSKAKTLQSYARMANYVSAGQAAAKANPPNYGALVDAAMGVAMELKTSGGTKDAPKKLADANKIITAGSALTQAVQGKNPEMIASAALGLAQALQTANYDEPNKDPNAKDSDGDGITDDREKVLKRYSTASSVIKFAGSAMEAAAAKPRPNYVAALSATTQLIADLTENKRMDQANLITQKFDAWTRAVQSKNENAIIDAGRAFGEAINGMRDLLEKEREEAKKAAEAKLAAGQTLEDSGAPTLPNVTFNTELTELPGTAFENRPDLHAGLPEDDLGEASLALPESTPVTPLRPTTGREHTPNANYTVFKGDSLGWIAQRFKTTVANLRSLNPQLKNDRIYENQRLFVPGADVILEGSVTTTETYRVAPGQAPAAPGQTPGAQPGTQPGTQPARPGQPGLHLELTPAGKQAFEYLKLLANLQGEFESRAAKDWIAMYEAYTNTIESFSTPNQKSSDTYKDAIQALNAVGATAKWVDTVGDELASYAKYFDPNNVAAARQGLRAIDRFKRMTGRLIKAGAIVPTFQSAATNMVVAAGYKADLSGAEATWQERLRAALDLQTEINSLRISIPWLGQMIRVLSTGTSVAQPVEGYNIVRRALNRWGDDFANAVMRFVTPILDKTAQKMGHATAVELAGRIAAEIGAWSATLTPGAAASNTFKAITKVLASRLGVVCRVGLSAPFAIAFEVARLEMEMAEHLYASAYTSFSMVLGSPLLFGRHINQLKADVRSKSFSDSFESVNAFYDYIWSRWLGGARGHVQNSWSHYARGTIGQLFTPGELGSNPLAFLKQYSEWREKWQAAHMLQQAALRFLDIEYQKEFGTPPMGG